MDSLRTGFSEKISLTVSSLSVRNRIEFFLNGERVSLPADLAGRTVLAWLREERRLTGTKEGCAEGDCGACTVVLADTDANGALRYRPAASCILLLGTLDGLELITVEALGTGGKPHPVQRAMVERHGSQCGFCTPGFVMALFAHYKNRLPSDRISLCDALAGNLCRCTGYAPILAAGEIMGSYRNEKQEARQDAECRARLASLPRDGVGGGQFRAPRCAEELAAALEPGATLLAGGTDLGLLVTKGLGNLGNMVYTGNVKELKSITQEQDHVQIGAAVTYAEAHQALARIHPDIGELLRRLGGAQVRAFGTLGGNIANASPIGDTMPVLLSLDAIVALQRKNATREAKISEFYTGYRKTILKPGEFIRSIRIPKLAPGARFAAYKLSKRFDQDISSVCAAFHLAPDGRAFFGFGGMAATPARAPKAEAAWAQGIDAACAALAEDFQPLSDHRASSWYRLTAAQNLLRKFAAGISCREIFDIP